MNNKRTLEPTPEKPDYTPHSASITRLPFVKDIKGNRKEKIKGHRNFWAVEPTDDYGYACRKGAEYAAHIIQYLKQNPGMAGSNILSMFVGDMNITGPFERTGKEHGYYVGFFSFIEKVLWNFANQNDAWAYFEQQDKVAREFYIQMMEEVEKEGEEE